MKKAVSLLFTALLVFSVVSCKTTQEDINDQFRGVYSAYRADIILDGAQTYTVVQNDSLSRIAAAQYGQGKGYFFPIIMLASKDVEIADPDLIEPGMVLTIPPLEANLENVTARGRIKQFLKDIADVYANKETTDRSTRIRNGLIELSNSL
jgi:hypothetical protein